MKRFINVIHACGLSRMNCCMAGLLITAAMVTPAKSQKNPEDFELIRAIYNNKKLLEFKYVNVTCDTFFYAGHFAIEGAVDDAIDFFSNKTAIKKGTGLAGPDSLQLSVTDLQLISNAFARLKKFEWPDSLFPHSKRINSSLVPAILAATDSSKVILEKKLCSQILSFLPPVFWGDGNWCIFFQAQSDILTQSGDCSVYHRENGEWKKYLYVARWMKF